MESPERWDNARVNFVYSSRRPRDGLRGASRALPERFVKGRPQPAELPQAVWINPPAKKTTGQDAPGSTNVTWDDLQVSRVSSANDHSAITMIDRGARH